MQLISTNIFPVAIGHSSRKNEGETHFGVKYCPSMDLVAVFPKTVPSDQAIDAVIASEASEDDAYYGEDEDEVLVDVYRLNGQKVFTIGIDAKGGAIGVSDIEWRDDGIVLAIATTDNKVRLVNSFSGKIVHTFASTSSSGTRNSSKVPASPNAKRKSSSRDQTPRKRRCIPTTIHYSTHFLDRKTAQTQLDTVDRRSATDLDDLLGLHADVQTLLKLKPDLPRAIANIDVEQYLPRLATLPANGFGEEDVFSSRTSIDAMFHPSSEAGRYMTDIVTVAESDAQLHIRIFDFFEVGDIDLNHAAHIPKGCHLTQVRQIASHPLSHKISLLVDEASDGPQGALHLLELELKLLEQSSLALPVVATKSTQLHNIIRYLRQIESQLAREIKTAFDLPARFIRTLEEDLKEQDSEGSTFQTSAYHALLTGEVSGKFKEWLTEVLGERGAKRWDKAVSDCLDLVRRLINENWNPAVERAGVVVSRLMGLALADRTFGIDTGILDRLRDTIDVMAVLGEDMLRDTIAEITGFNAFMKWVKREVEMAGLEDTSERLEEIREITDHHEVRKVTKYIAERLHNTSVKKYTQDSGLLIEEKTDGSSFYETFKAARRTGVPVKMPYSLKTLTDRIAEQCNKLFNQVAEKLQAQVQISYIAALDNVLDADMLECRVRQTTPDQKGGEDLIEPIAVGCRQNENAVNFWLLQKGVIKRHKQELKDTTKVLDLKVVDDTEILLLVTHSSQLKIISISLANVGKSEAAGQITKHVFGGKDDAYIRAGLQPAKLEINGRKGRRTATVLDEQGRGYGVFDLDTGGYDGKNEIMAG